MIDFCNKYHIILGHSTTYYPQGNGLAESSNKSLMNIIKKLLKDNKKLVNALWADRLATEKSIGTSPYQLVYGMEVVFPSSLGGPMMKLLQEAQERIKKAFDKRTKAEDFYLGDKVLKWDSRREDKGKHGKFDFLWKGPYIIYAFRGNNAYFLKELDGAEAEGGPVNSHMLKQYIDLSH
eukprot:PITA_21719